MCPLLVSYISNLTAPCIIVDQHSAGTLPAVLNCHRTYPTIVSIVLVFCSFHFLHVLHSSYMTSSGIPRQLCSFTQSSRSFPITSLVTSSRSMSLSGSGRWPWNESNIQQSRDTYIASRLGAVFSPGFECQRAHFSLTSFGLSITAPLHTQMSLFINQQLAKGHIYSCLFSSHYNC